MNKNYTERRLEELKGWMANVLEHDGEREYIKSFLSTSIAQAVAEERERCVEVVKSLSPTDYKGYGLQAGGGLVQGMTDDYKRIHAKQIIEALTPPTK